MERYGCLGARWGWLPRHVLAWEGDTLVGAVPMYLKYNSYGEFVFDWSWADAYRRAGLSYYPKLVVGVPYTPASGARLLLDAGREAGPLADALIAAARAVATDADVSSLHWLFTQRADTQRLQEAGFMRRTGCQFHWHNRGYRDFEDFLQGFSAKNRKKLRRERRRVQEAGVEL